MTIKPVLVPDHDAADLRKLMDHFATAAQSATPAAQANRIRQQLTESAEPGVAEATGDSFEDEELNEGLSHKIKKIIKAYKNLFLKISYNENGKKIMSGPKAHKEASRQLGVDPDDMEEYLRLEYYDFFDTVNKEWEKQKGNRKERYSNEIWGKVDGQPQPRSPSTGWIVGEVDEDPTKIKEDRPDVMRHRGDKTIKIVKRAGKPIGEIGTDSEASPGNGPYYVKLYDGSYDAVGFDSAEEALAELKYAIKSGVAEGSIPGIGSNLPRSDIETFGLQKGRSYKINPPEDFKPGDRKRAVQQLIPTQDKKDHIRSRLGKHVAPALPEQDMSEGSGEFNKIKTTPYKANQMLGGKDPVAFAIEVLCPDQSVVETIQNKIGTAYQIERDDAVEGNGIGIEIISQSFEGGRTAQAAYKQILDIIKQSGGQFNNSTEVTIARQTQGVVEDEVEEGWKSKLAAAGLAGAAALGGYAAGSSNTGSGFSNTKGIDQFNKPAVSQTAQVQPLRTRADLDAYNKTRPAGTSKLVNLPKDFEEDIAESVDPIEQLRADIRRFSR